MSAPGRRGRLPRWLRVVLWVAVVAAGVVLLFTVVFPRVERVLENPTLGAAAVVGAPDAHAERSPR